MRIAIVFNQGASILVAGKLDSIWVDRVNRGEESRTVVDDNSLVVVVSGGGELRVGVGVNVGVATDHWEFDAVGALGDTVVVGWLWLVVLVMDLWLVGTVVVVVSVVVGVVVSGGVDVVVRVAVIGDQGAASIIAGELNLAGIDLIDWGNDGLSVNLDHSLVRADCCGSELWVNVSSSLDVTSSNVEGNAVGALRLTVVVTIGIALMLVATREVVAVRELGISAGEDSSAGIVHLLCESELLAVKNESVSVLIKIALSIRALILNTIDKVSSRLHLGVVSILVLPDIILISSNSATIVRNFFVNRVDIVAEVVDGSLEGLEGDKDLSLNLNSLFVVVLIPNLLVLVELVDLLVEVGAWKFFTVFLGVIRLSVVASNGEVGLSNETMVSTLSLEGGGVGGKSGGGKGNSEFHNFILKV